MNAGSFRTIFRIATVAPSAGSPRGSGVAGMPRCATEPPQTVSSRRREQAQRHRDRQRLRSAAPEPVPLTPEVERAASTIDQDVPPLADPRTAVNSSCVGQRPAEIPENSRLWPCGRPGCYVLFPLSPRFPRQHFCSCSCRRALRRIWQRESRLRRRRRYGRPRRCSCRYAQPQASSLRRHVIEQDPAET